MKERQLSAPEVDFSDDALVRYGTDIQIKDEMLRLITEFVECFGNGIEDLLFVHDNSFSEYPLAIVLCFPELTRR